MTSIHRITQQSLEHKLGVELAISSCAPVAFYMLLKANGYLDDDLEPDTFCFALDKDRLSSTGSDWSRPALTRHLRMTYHADIVSWQFGGLSPTNFEKMVEAGYIESQREIEFFKQTIEGRDIANIVRDGYPVITTMRPGFGVPNNHNIHAVIILEWKHGKVTIVDPDARNTGHIFDEQRVRRFISPAGAGSVILPRT